MQGQSVTLRELDISIVLLEDLNDTLLKKTIKLLGLVLSVSAFLLTECNYNLRQANSFMSNYLVDPL